jgi:hypothetical protein
VLQISLLSSNIKAKCLHNYKLQSCHTQTPETFQHVFKINPYSSKRWQNLNKSNDCQFLQRTVFSDIQLHKPQFLDNNRPLLFKGRELVGKSCFHHTAKRLNQMLFCITLQNVNMDAGWQWPALFFLFPELCNGTYILPATNCWPWQLIQYQIWTATRFTYF